MKNRKMNSRLADFENELENLNHSEMKEVVGGDYGYVSGGGSGGVMTYTCVATPSSAGNFGGYNSYSAFLSSYPSCPVITSGSYSGGGGTTSASSLTSKETQCVQEYDSRNTAKNIAISLTPLLQFGAIGAAGVVPGYLYYIGQSGRTLADCLR